MGVDDDENELSMMDFIHCFVETLDWHFGNVCELDIMFPRDLVYRDFRRDGVQRTNRGDEQKNRTRRSEQV